METSRLRKPDLRNKVKYMNTKHLERLQKVMDAANTRTSNIQLRKQFLEHQHRMNLRNEFDRLRGSFSRLGKDDLIRAEIQKLFGARDAHKLKELGEYVEEQEDATEGSPTTTPMRPTFVRNVLNYFHTPPSQTPSPQPKAKGRPKAQPRGQTTPIFRRGGRADM